MRKELPDDETIDLITNCNTYLLKHLELEEIFSKAWFQLMLAKRSNRQFQLSLCREELDPKVKISEDSEGIFQMELEKAVGDPALYMSGMPSVNTRNAQSLFQDALKVILTIANNAKKIRKASVLDDHPE